MNFINRRRYFDPLNEMCFSEDLNASKDCLDEFAGR